MPQHGPVDSAYRLTAVGCTRCIVSALTVRKRSGDPIEVRDAAPRVRISRSRVRQHVVQAAIAGIVVVPVLMRNKIRALFGRNKPTDEPCSCRGDGTVAGRVHGRAGTDAAGSRPDLTTSPGRPGIRLPGGTRAASSIAATVSCCARSSQSGSRNGTRSGTARSPSGWSQAASCCHGRMRRSATPTTTPPPRSSAPTWCRSSATPMSGRSASSEMPRS